MEIKMSSWGSYPKIYNVGHPALAGFFDEPVAVEEKVDGSQFSFGIFDGVVKLRSKSREFDVYSADRMFQRAADTVANIAGKLRPEWTYRGEYLNSPHHNALTYNRVPEGHIVLFDVASSYHTYLDYSDKVYEAKRIGLEVVPQFFLGMVASVTDVESLLEQMSMLGGPTVEGLVFKRVSTLWGTDKKPLIAKYVSSAFREVHKTKVYKVGKLSLQEQMIARYKTDARWEKSIQHLRDDGQLVNEPKDIGPLIKAIQQDLIDECGDQIKGELFAWFMRDLTRGVVRGFPEFYKAKLLESQFGEGRPPEPV